MTTTTVLRGAAFVACLTASWMVAAQGQRPPQFRAGIELLQLDVTVLDKTGKPVRGLTKEDFTLLEDGKPQTVEAFTEIFVPEAVRTGPAWSRDVTPDVTNNQIDNKRIFVIVINDARGLGGPLGRKNTLDTASMFIDALGPQDLAAVVFTATVKASQGLTSDRAKLLKALQAAPYHAVMPTMMPSRGIGSGMPPPPIRGMECLSIKESLRTIDAIVDHLSTMPDRRKAIIYYGVDLPWAMAPQSDTCGTYWLWRDIFTKAQQGHVSINPVQAESIAGRVNPDEVFLAVAENTGGHAVTGNNDLRPGLRQILVENSSYYLLAYQMRPGDPDGTYRHLSVKVNRPDLEVVTRRGYWTPRTKPSGEPVDPPSPDLESIAGILPSAKLNLSASAAVFAAASGKGQATIAITLGIKQPAFADRAREVIDLLVNVYSVDGDPKGSETSTIPIAVPRAPAGATDSDYEVLSRIDVAKPGRYEVRLSARSNETAQRGSVYLDVEVPDFAKAKVSMSGVVISNPLTSTAIAPNKLFADLAPDIPTSQRTFSKTADHVLAYLKVIQGGSGKLAPVTVKTQIRDVANSMVLDQSDTYAPDRFGPDRSADVKFAIPLDRLAVGEHLLTFEAALDKTKARRDVVFVVR